MNKKIKSIVQKFLDHGTIEDGYNLSVVDTIEHSSFKTTGVICVEEIKPGLCYDVSYETLIPLHGSGSDNINIISSVKIV